MQRVSKAYKESMKSSLRERAYIMISFGLVNQEAQAKAKIEKGEFAYYTNTENIFGEKSDDTIYATLEENFTNGSECGLFSACLNYASSSSPSSIGSRLLYIPS